MHIKRDEGLRDSNTLSLPAVAHAATDLGDVDELVAICDWANRSGLSILPLGQGSNVVLSGDLECLVVRVKNRGIDIIEEDDASVLLRIAAGEDWHHLVQWCLSRGYYGLENLALIPGTAGAAPIQNIGAYGVELHTFLERVHATRVANGKPMTLGRRECRFGYRDSIFKNSLKDKLIITAIELRLAKKPEVTIDYPALASFFESRNTAQITPEQVFDAVVSIRRSRLPDPVTMPNAGSFFKNPVVSAEQARDLSASYPGLPVYPMGQEGTKLAAAWLIEHCGWKGYRQGDVGVHPEHALVLVNYGDGCGEDILALAARITASVKDTFGLELVVEPRVYGDRP